MKKLLIIGGIVVLVLIVIVLLVPLFINVDSFRPDVEAKLSTALGRQVRIGKLSASIFSGAAADNISISDDAAFSRGPFLQASKLEIGVDWLPLIFSHQLQISSLTIRNPEVTLLKNNAGRWNFSTLGGNAPAQSSQASSQAAPNFSVAHLAIRNGQIKVGQSSGRQVAHLDVYKNVELDARNISATGVIPFTASADTPGGGSLALKGQAGPLHAGDMARTPLDATLELKHVNLAETGFFDPTSGLAGTVDFTGTLKSDGRHLRSEGNAKASNLRVAKGGAPTRQPMTLDYKSDYALDSDMGTLNANLHTGGSTANAAGTINSRGASTIANLKVTGKNMAVDDIQGLLPAFGITMPSGAKLQGGTANLDLTAEGPLDRLVISGPASITGARLSGFSLGSKLAPIAALTGLQPGSDTLIQRFSSGLRVAPEGIRAENIVLSMPSLGDVTGNGVIGSNQALDFKMLLKPANGTAGMLGQMNQILGQSGAKGIPFLIQGTASDPRFMPALAGAAGGLLQGNQGQQGQGGLGGVLGGLLGGKKKK
jgi:AsmA protein